MKKNIKEIVGAQLWKSVESKKGKEAGMGEALSVAIWNKKISKYFFHLESCCFKIRFPQMHFLRTFVSLMGNNVWLNVLQVPNCCWPYGQKANVTDIAK